MARLHKIILTITVCFVVFGLLASFASMRLGKVRIIACDVGQGDGLLIITPGGKDIVIDSGPGSRILDCLSKYMPFWDKTVEMMVLSHPQQDHMEGQVAVFGNYKVENMVTTGIKNDTQLYSEWKKALDAEGARIYKPLAGDEIKIGEVGIDVLWPSGEKYGQWAVSGPSDLNDSSVILRLNYGGSCAYFTGDIPFEILETVAGKNCAVLKVAHHGSRTGTSEKVIDEIKPKLAIIQVGKNNKFGHPHKEIMDMFSKAGIKVLRNDELGDIEVDLDSKGNVLQR